MSASVLLQACRDQNVPLWVGTEKGVECIQLDALQLSRLAEGMKVALRNERDHVIDLLKTRGAAAQKLGVEAQATLWWHRSMRGLALCREMEESRQHRTPQYRKLLAQFERLLQETMALEDAAKQRHQEAI